ncbi:MAG: hypothetical protein BSOLF_0171 [Candidatus Carbobacillus altaicus]|uniref:Uncharacterized protein n=1 Tax=Candidatus Carbonibacillus altaicus TaxID=2163959 RepID=A0A2R6Y1A5_9BACL|nr:MAG: hypothetical protein BSOLF_0171 [Candidatus Carbobacillus altaicus]
MTSHHEMGLPEKIPPLNKSVGGGNMSHKLINQLIMKDTKQ